MLNATTGSPGLLIKNSTVYYELNYHNGSASSNAGMFTARCAGALGNSLRVSVCASANAFSENERTTINDTSLAVGDTSMDVTSAVH